MLTELDILPADDYHRVGCVRQYVRRATAADADTATLHARGDPRTPSFTFTFT